MTVHLAVVTLRAHMGETQQEFATRIGISISALSNYERHRTPEPKQLVAFLLCAKVVGREDLVKVFRQVFLDELGLQNPRTLYHIIK